MPTIQELMPAPSFGGELGKAIGTGFGQGFSSGIQNQLASFQKQKQNKSIISGLMPLFKQANIEFSPEEEETIINSGVDPQILATFGSNIYKQKQAQQTAQNKTAVKQQDMAEKQQRAEQDKAQEYQQLAGDFDYLESLLPYSFTIVPGQGTTLPDYRQKSEELDKSGFWLTDRVYTHFNKGTISVPKYNDIKKYLAPRKDLPPQVNQGRFNALKRIAGLPSDVGQKDFNQVVNEEINRVRKIPTSTPGQREESKPKRSLEEIFG